MKSSAQEHKKNMISEKWYEYSTTNDIITFFILSQMQR